MVQEITLSSGIVVRVRPVPPLLSRQVIASMSNLRRPRIPLLEIKGVAGTELVTAREGQPEYERWVQQVDEIEAETRRVQDNFIWNWGVVSWCEPGNERFFKNPPKSWQIPELLVQFGLVPSDTDALTRRLLYIQAEFRYDKPAKGRLCRVVDANRQNCKMFVYRSNPTAEGQ